jgi:hypothetical protein
MGLDRCPNTQKIGHSSPIATRIGIAVAFLSIGALTIVPSRRQPANAIRPRERANRTVS